MINRRLLAETVAKRTMRLKSTKALASKVAAFLLAENLTSMADSIMRDVIAYRAEHGLLEATIVSAYPVTALVRRDVMAELKKEYPNASSIVLNERLDLGVVGGLRIESVNEQLDLSVRAKLNTLKRLTAARNT